jgi:hypothetical protein
MPHFYPNTLIVELKPLSAHALLRLLNILIKQGVLELYMSITPSVVDIATGEKIYSIAIAPFTFIIPHHEIILLENSEFKVYKTSRDAWIDSVKLKTQQLLNILTALISSDYKTLIEQNIIVENKVDCEDILLCFPLTVKSIAYFTKGRNNIIRAYRLYKEMLRKQKIVIAICVVNTNVLPYAWIEKRERAEVLVLRRCEKPGEDELVIKIILDYLAAQSSKFNII